MVFRWFSSFVRREKSGKKTSASVNSRCVGIRSGDHFIVDTLWPLGDLFGANIFFCLHTAAYSQVAFNGKLLAKASTKILKLVTRTTGAGDSWHGGIVKGISILNKPDLLSLNKEDWYEILLFANSVAGYWVFKGRPGSLEEIKNWLA